MTHFYLYICLLACFIIIMAYYNTYNTYMSLTDINKDIDMCLLKYIIGRADFDIDEVSKKIYDGLIENNKLYMDGEMVNGKTFVSLMFKLYGSDFNIMMKEHVIIK